MTLTSLVHTQTCCRAQSPHTIATSLSLVLASLAMVQGLSSQQVSVQILPACVHTRRL